MVRHTTAAKIHEKSCPDMLAKSVEDNYPFTEQQNWQCTCFYRAVGTVTTPNKLVPCPHLADNGTCSGTKFVKCEECNVGKTKPADPEPTPAYPESVKHSDPEPTPADPESVKPSDPAETTKKQAKKTKPCKKPRVMHNNEWGHDIVVRCPFNNMEHTTNSDGVRCAILNGITKTCLCIQSQTGFVNASKFDLAMRGQLPWADCVTPFEEHFWLAQYYR
jgi:hypothetical protein